MKKRASLIVKHGRQHERIPCLVLDSSPDGFRLRGNARLRRRQVVEVILDEDPFNVVHCSVIWVGKPGSKNEGEVGVANRDSLNSIPVGNRQTVETREGLSWCSTETLEVRH